MHACIVVIGTGHATTTLPYYVDPLKAAVVRDTILRACNGTSPPQKDVYFERTYCAYIENNTLISMPSPHPPPCRASSRSDKSSIPWPLNRPTCILIILCPISSCVERANSLANPSSQRIRVQLSRNYPPRVVRPYFCIQHCPFPLPIYLYPFLEPAAH